MKTNKVIGIILNYLLAVVDVLVALLFIPFLISSLGDSDYGIYKLMQSTAAYLSVLDFGIGSTITRYVIKYKVQKERQKEENFVAMGLIIYAVLAAVVLLISVGVAIAIPGMYAKSLSTENYALAQQVFFVICLTTSVSLFNHAYSGLLIAYEKFALTSGLNIVKILCRVGLIVFGMQLVSSPLTVVLVDLLVELMLLCASMLYTKSRLKCRIKLHKWDWPLAKEAFVFTLAIFAQSVINQFNTNLDNIVLGIYTSTVVVSMYSVVLQIYTLYSTVATSISTVYLPSISAKVFAKKSDEEITDSVIFPSRIQLALLLLVFTGFLLLGRDFVGLWLNREGYEAVYLLTCVLLGAATLELSQTSITSVLKAKNVLAGRSVILAISTAVNAVITFTLVPRIGAMGAVLGTAFSLVFGYGIALSVYYKKAAQLNMKRYYKAVYARLVPLAALAAAIGWLVLSVIPGTGLLLFLVRGVVYVAIYGSVVGILGLTADEKHMVTSWIRKKKPKAE